MLLGDELTAHSRVLTQTVEELAQEVTAVVNCLGACLVSRGKLLLCGNGGSAADCQHVAAEFVNRLRHDRRALPALALSTDTSVLTSIANDDSYSQVFARQIQALAGAEDVVAAISTSGRSENILRALESARKAGVATIGFTGAGGKESMGPLCDYLLAIPSTDCARIQEAHIFLWHHIAGSVEVRLLEAHETRTEHSLAGARGE